MVVVDEGSMVDLASLAELLERANGARIVILGDTRQLGAIGGGAPMAALASPSVLGTQRLKTIRRQAEEWQREASMAFSRGEHARAFQAYDDCGDVAWVEGREAAFDRLVADWTADLVCHPAGQRLCLAYRHTDVGAINERCRSAYRSAGHLTGPDVELQAVGRGRRAVPETISLGVGDRVIFGETIEIAGVSVRNSDMATIEAIDTSSADPTVRFRLDKGVVLETRWSALVGRRKEGCKVEQRIPRIQHAYCVSIHSAQGLTVGSGNPTARIHGSTFVYNSGLGAQSSLVAMTRHVDTCQVYVETSRIKDRILARKAARGIMVDRAGRLEAPDADDIASSAPDTNGPRC